MKRFGQLHRPIRSVRKRYIILKYRYKNGKRQKLIYCRYKKGKNGKKIYPKKAKFFRFWVNC